MKFHWLTPTSLPLPPPLPEQIYDSDINEEITMPLYAEDGAGNLADIPQAVIAGATDRYQKLSRAIGVIVSLKLHQDAALETLKSQTAFADTPVTNKLSLPDVILPGEVCAACAMRACVCVCVSACV